MNGDVLTATPPSRSRPASSMESSGVPPNLPSSPHLSSAHSTPSRPGRRYPATFESLDAISSTNGHGNYDTEESVYHRAGLVNDCGRQYEHYRRTDEELKAFKNKKVRKFYEGQNALLDTFNEVDELLDATTHAAFEEIDGETTALLPKYNPGAVSGNKEAATKASVKFAVNINLVLNLVLLVGKLLVVLISNSVSLIASVIDSAMDFLSTIILFGANRAIESPRWRGRYPVGLRRAEPMGVVIFSVAMISSFIQVAIESCKRLAEKDLETIAIPRSGIIIMLVTIGSKAIVWIGSRKSKSATIQALAQDAENDVMFNIFSIVFPFIGQRLDVPWLDPVGGLVLSVYIIYEWFQTLRVNIRSLMGARSSPHEHQRVLYLVMRFSPYIRAVQHIEVYSCGDQVIAEVDLVLPADISLPKAHHIGESVQYALESLSGIERAYCHVDYNSQNPSGHVIR